MRKRIFIQLIDQNWKLHIQYLEQLRQVIGLRSYGQRDPLVEYKKEAFILFENLLNKLKNRINYFLINLKIVENQEKDNNFSQEQNKKFKELSSKKLGGMNFVLVTQVKNINIVADPYKIKNKENIKIKTLLKYKLI